MSSFSTGPKRTEEEIRKLQDQKNLQDFMYQTNTAIQDIHLAVKQLHCWMSQHVAETGQKHVQQNICQEDHAEANRDMLNTFHKYIDALKDNILEISKAQVGSLPSSEFKDYRALMQVFVDASNSKNRILSHQVEELKKQVAVLETRIDDKVKHELYMFRREINEKPSEIPQVEEKVKNQLDVYQVEFNGLQKELRVFKQDLLVKQKEIEDLYNQLNRLR